MYKFSQTLLEITLLEIKKPESVSMTWISIKIFIFFHFSLDTLYPPKKEKCLRLLLIKHKSKKSLEISKKIEVVLTVNKKGSIQILLAYIINNKLLSTDSIFPHNKTFDSIYVLLCFFIENDTYSRFFLDVYLEFCNVFMSEQGKECKKLLKTVV